MLKEQIDEDLKTGMKAHDAVAVSTLRMLMSAIMYSKIDRNQDRNDVSDQDVVEVVQKEVKKRRESIDLYRKGGREEQAIQEEKEIEVLQKYLPEQMSEENVQKIVKEAIAETGASGMADMGRVMSVVMGKVRGQADGSVVSAVVREELGT